MLSKRRYLIGNSLTEADVRLFVSLIRFDVVYHGHFKVNAKSLVISRVKTSLRYSHS